MKQREFQVLSKLGEGSFSSVWKVKRVSDGQEYAMKKVKMSSLSEKEKENALNEVRILASINNPHIIGYKEAFFEDNTFTLCIVMEYAAGGDIYNKIVHHQKAKTFFKEDEIWSYAIQMIVGLKTLHDMKILHRDLKSANIFLSKDGKGLKLGDLNVSKIAKTNLVYTQTGTPYYASPEVWRDQPYDLKSDIWSLGCVLYEMCSLKPPFRAADMKGLYKKIQRGEFERIPLQYSSDLSRLISMCLQTSPTSRPNCDKLLSHPLLINHWRELRQKLVNSSVSNELIETIRLPKNFKALAEKLPKPNYAENKCKENEKKNLLKVDQKPLQNLNEAREYLKQPTHFLEEKVLRKLPPRYYRIPSSDKLNLNIQNKEERVSPKEPKEQLEKLNILKEIPSLEPKNPNKALLNAMDNNKNEKPIYDVENLGGINQLKNLNKDNQLFVYDYRQENKYQDVDEFEKMYSPRESAQTKRAQYIVQKYHAAAVLAEKREPLTEINKSNQILSPSGRDVNNILERYNNIYNFRESTKNTYIKKRDGGNTASQQENLNPNLRNNKKNYKFEGDENQSHENILNKAYKNQLPPPRSVFKPDW